MSDMQRNQPLTSHVRVTNYDTRLDQFRARNRIAVRQWAEAAGILRTQFHKYRSGAMKPRVVIFGALVHSAAAILRRPVRASELFDVGEDEPVASTPWKQEGRRPLAIRKRYESRLDELLRSIGVPATAVAREAGMSRQALLRFRMGQGISVSSVALLVRALRRMGYGVTASDIVDLGER